VAGHIENMAQSIKEVTKLYKKSAQLWTSLHEDEKLQALEQKKERVNIVAHDLKKKRKEMNIHDRPRSA
jgi:hypothetical protein